MCIAEINLHGERLTNMRGVGKGDTLLFVSKTEAFDRVPLREPTHANVLVSVRGNDVRLIGCEDKCGKERGVPQDERSARRVFVRGESVRFRILRGSWRRCRQRCEWVTQGT
jgi:hypothetical protein